MESERRMSTSDEQYPEHAKLSAVSDESQSIGEFLDGSEYVIAEWVEIDGLSEPRLLPTSKTINEILADHFGIDLDKIEAEKQAMLAQLVNAHRRTP